MPYDRLPILYRALPFKIFGEARYGERKAIVEAEDWEGPDFKTCANAASICRSFECSRRREHLAFTHHAEVAALPPAEADALLGWCEETVRDTAKPPLF
jgi:hypothetical protein